MPIDSERTANRLALFGLGFYALSSWARELIGAAAGSAPNFSKAETCTAAVAVAGACILLVTRFTPKGRRAPAAFLVPSILLAGVLVAGYLLHDLSDIYLLYPTITGLGMFYNAPKPLALFAAVWQTALFPLSFTLIPRYSVMSMPTCLMMWTISIFVVGCMLFGTYTAERTARRSRNTIAVLETMLGVTARYTLVVNGQNEVTFISGRMTEFLNMKNFREAVGRPAWELFENEDDRLLIHDLFSSREELTIRRGLKGAEFDINAGRLNGAEGRYINMSLAE